MRAFKFRGWNGYTMFYEEWNENANVFLTSKDFLGRPDLEVMQFTGLKDNNGIEIYEGDIVSGFNGTLTGQVIWDQEEPSFQYKGNTGGGALLNAEYMLNFAIIGNIYEDAILLSTNTGTAHVEPMTETAESEGEVK